MIGKILPAHANFASTVAYVLRKAGAVKLDVGTMPSDRIRVLQLDGAMHLRDAQALGYQGAKPAFHAILSLHPSEKLDDAQWSKIVDRYMKGLGYGDSPWLAVRHDDTDHSHVHIVGLRFERSTGRHVDERFNWARSRDLCDAIERDYGLMPGAPNRVAPRRSPTSKEVQEARREKVPPELLPRQQIWHALDASLRSKPSTLPELARNLDQHGVRLVPNVAKSTDRVSGLRYVHVDSGRSFRAGELGPDAKLKGLAALGVQVGNADLLRGAKAHDAELGQQPVTEAERQAAASWRAFLEEAPAPALPSVQDQIEQMIGALEADSYRITASHPDGRTQRLTQPNRREMEKLATPAALVKAIPRMAALHARGWNVRVFPFKRGARYLTLDGVEGGALREMLDEGHRPSLVLSTGPRHASVVLRVEAEGHDDRGLRAWRQAAQRRWGGARADGPGIPLPGSSRSADGSECRVGVVEAVPTSSPATAEAASRSHLDLRAAYGARSHNKDEPDIDP